MPTTVPNPCDQLEVDLSRIDLDVEIQSAPCIDVEITQTDITIDSVSVAGQGPPGRSCHDSSGYDHDDGTGRRCQCNEQRHHSCRHL